MGDLRLVPAPVTKALAFTRAVHRTLDAPNTALWAVAVADPRGVVRGVALVSWPSAPRLNDGATGEVLRVATDGAPNACSMLYGAAWRAARPHGFTRLVTYTEGDEDGRSVASAGWVPTPTAGGGASWGNRPGRTSLRRATTRWTVQAADHLPLTLQWTGELDLANG